MAEKQSNSFKELGAFLAYKTGSGQVWNKRYRAALDQYIDKYGVDVLIGACLRSEFDKVEYAIEIWRGLDNRTEDQEWWIPAARERYHLMRKEYIQGKFDGSGINRLAKSLGFRTSRHKKKWNPVEELKAIIERTGLPRGQEAEEFRRKWNLTV